MTITLEKEKGYKINYSRDKLPKNAVTFSFSNGIIF